MFVPNSFSSILNEELAGYLKVNINDSQSEQTGDSHLKLKGSI